MRPSRMLPLLAAVLLVGVSAGCRRAAPPPQPGAPVKVTLLLNWFPEAEHGGFYTALVEGYFADEGLDVEILPGGPGASVVARVATGAVDFGVENADHVVLARAQQAQVTALLAPIQTHPRCIMVHAATGITNLYELADLTLAMNAGGAFAHYLRHHVPLPGVRIVPFGGNVSQFLTDTRVAQQGYTFSEPFLARRAGADPRTLLLADIGFNPYTSCLIVRESLLNEHPDLARRMVRAAVRGWQRYLEAPEATHARIHTLNPEMDPELLRFGWEALLPLVWTETARKHGLGTMTAERWEELVRALETIGLIPAGAVSPATCWRNPTTSAINAEP